MSDIARPWRAIEFRVRGTPAPKGSTRGRAGGVIPGSSAGNRDGLVSWTSAVRDAAAKAVDQLVGVGIEVIPFVKQPLRFTAVWYMRRPKSHFYQNGPRIGQVRDDAPYFHIVKPDASKLIRATEDDLINLVFDDDCTLAEHRTRKIYAAPGKEGAWVKIELMEQQCPTPP